MELKSETQLQLLSSAELARRTSRVAEGLRAAGLDAMLVADNANIYYLTGRVFYGYVIVDTNGTATYFLRRPNHLRGSSVHEIHKPEQLPEILARQGLNYASVGFEDDSMPFAEYSRLAKVFPSLTPASQVMRNARMVKTAEEIEKLRRCGIAQTEVYATIPHLYQEGMSDVELQIEIERALRLHGCLGMYRVAGRTLEIFMGSLLTGDNADTPSPYDFAMGGAGVDPSLPAGANGTIIKPGHPVMVDMNGNFNGYNTDMTRCYCVGEPLAEAVQLNEVSRRICEAIAQAATPGTPAAELYNLAAGIAQAEGLADAFMGHRYHAGFVGHGVGIQLNELPVLAPRSRDVLQAGMVIAVEPKFVVPGIGAVGIENTYVVRPDGPAENLTTAPEGITNLR